MVKRNVVVSKLNALEFTVFASANPFFGPFLWAGQTAPAPMPH